MIRNGIQRKLTAQAERERLLAQWDAYPVAVRDLLATLLRDYGLRATEIATEAVAAARLTATPREREEHA